MIKLLIIDDDIHIRKIVRIQLGKTSIEVTAASGRIEAEAHLKKTSFDIFICDIKMKDSNGMEILKNLKTDYPDTPVIMLTGFIDKKYYDAVMELGAYDCLTKPVKKERLIKIIEEALGKKVT
ncbi:MAG: response regulator [Spirochaetales bacterium]|nr:response regulator [Spirochaetales bacterium]